MKKRYELSLQDGQKLFGLQWLIDQPIGNVLIMEGMEEHSSRYDEFATYLNTQGFNVFCLDTFGQGENVKEDLSNRGIWPVDGFKKQVDAENDVVVKLNESGLPTFLFAHSMGSFMAQSFIQRYPNQVKKVVLCGAGGKNAAVNFGYFLAKIITTEKKRNEKAKLLNSLMFGGFNKHISNPKTAYDWLSYNEENVNRYNADPLSGFGPNNGFCLEFLKGLKNLFKKSNLKNVNQTIQLFIISGEEDPVTNYSKSVDRLKSMYVSFNVKDVQTKIYPHLRHEILNENSRMDVYQDIANFLKA
jgi:alpha-beta hydrolase superfamily lysophospholipase